MDEVIKKEIEELRRELAKKFEDMKAQRLNESEFRERAEKIDARIDELEKKIAEFRKPGVQEVKVEPDHLKAFRKYLRNQPLEPEERKTLVVGTDSAGGYLAPKEWAGEIDRALIQFSPIRSVSRVVAISGRSLLVPTIGASGYGNASITAEAGTITPADMTFGQVELVPYKFTRAIKVSKELLQDNAFNLDSLLAEWFGELFGKLEGTKFVKGSGTGEPKGVTVDTNVTTYTTATAGTLAADDVIKAYHSIPTPYAVNGVWTMNRNTLQAIRLMKDSQNRYLFVPDPTGAAPGTIYGRPVIECPDYDDIAASAVVATFGDFKSGFWVVDRQGIEVLVADQLYAATQEIAFFATKRTGGGVVRGEALVNVVIKS